MNHLLQLGVVAWPPRTYQGAPELWSVLALLAGLLALLWLIDHFFGRYLRRFL